MNAVKIVMGKVIEFAIGPALVFSLPILLLGERTRWGDHVFFTYKQRLSSNDQRMAMAVGQCPFAWCKTFGPNALIRG